MGHSKVPARRRDGLVFGALALLAGCASGPSSTPASRPSALTNGYEVRAARDDDGGGPAGMGVASEHGFISQEDAQEAIGRRFRDLTRCYGQAGDAQDFAGGAVRMRFHVDPQGKASDVQVYESGLGSFEVERCLVGVGLTIGFPRPQGGAAATVEYSLEFRSTGEIPVVDVASSEVESAVPAQLPQLATTCAHKLGAPELVATMYVDARGGVRSVGLAADTRLDAEAAACTARALRGWSLPVSVQGRGLGRVSVSLRERDLAAAVAAAEEEARVAKRQGRRARRR